VSSSHERATGALPPTLVLAAGKGTRLGELGRERAKVLVPIGGRPLLDLHLEHLGREGVRRVVINSHHLSDQIIAHVDGYRGPLAIDVLVEPVLLGTAGAAINALPALGQGAFVVLYGDVLIFEPLEPLLRAHRTTGAAATVCVYQHDDPRGKGVVEVDGADRVERFSEKDPSRTGPGLVNAGLYVVEPRLLDGLPRDTFLDFGHDVFPLSVRAGHHVQAFRIPRPVLDIGTPEDLAVAVSDATSQSGLG
jgi:mannose-1-phosphate guanylyltransferase